MSHKEMQQVLTREDPSWKSALSYVKDIYVITDKSNGKLYIGSASGNTDGIWQRWAGYAHLENLTGGNKEFNNIVLKNGRAHIQEYFQYSILEIFDTRTKSEIIIERENYWKSVFDTKKHGMNHN